MPTYTVLGTRTFNYKRKFDGSIIPALEIHASYKPSPRDGETYSGNLVERLFIPMDKVTSVPDVGSTVEIWYNRYGAVEGYSVY